MTFTNRNSRFTIGAQYCSLAYRGGKPNKRGEPGKADLIIQRTVSSRKVGFVEKKQYASERRKITFGGFTPHLDVLAGVCDRKERGRKKLEAVTKRECFGRAGPCGGEREAGQHNEGGDSKIFFPGGGNAKNHRTGSSL